MIVGIDFDNTLICYDALFQRLALEAGLPVDAGQAHKGAVRQAARASREGDLAWQRLQGQAYGPRIMEAPPMAGALSFLRSCTERQVPLFVISHKTPFASIDPTGTPLRPAALDWLGAQGFFEEGTGLAPERVIFASSRAEKLAQIRATGCTAFIDDLEETFLEPGFPAGVQGYLFAPWGASPRAGLRIAGSWAELREAILGA